MSEAEDLQKAKAEITKSIRDLLTFKITLPLGNPNYKLIHTNTWITTYLPEDFVLENFGIIGEKLNSTDTRYSGYAAYRFYVEGVTINNEAGGEGTIELELNPFASSIAKYKDENANFVKAYEDAVNKSKDSNTSTSSNDDSSSPIKGGEGKVIDNLVKKIIGNETNELKKAKLVHEWLKNNVRYRYYTCTRYNTAEKCYNHRGQLNCADTARLTRAMMSSAGLNAWVVHRSHSNGHFWTLIKINGKIYASDQTGSGSAWNTIWYAKGDRRKCNSRGGNWDRNNGKVPDC